MCSLYLLVQVVYAISAAVILGKIFWILLLGLMFYMKYWFYTRYWILWMPWIRQIYFRSSHPEVFVGKGVLKISSKFTGEHPCRSAISINLQSNIIEITLRHRCSPVNLLHVFRTLFSKNTSGRLLLSFQSKGFWVLCCWQIV